MTPERKSVVQQCRENQLRSFRSSAEKDEPKFTRFLTPRTKFKIRTLKWTRDALIREVDRLNAELIEARLTAEEAWDAHDEKEHHERAA